MATQTPLESRTTASGPAPTGASRARVPRRAMVLAPLAVFAGGIALWEGICRLGIVNVVIVPPPSDVATAFVDLVQTAYFWENFQVTATETLVGFVIGVSLAWVIGTLIGMFDTVRYALYPPAVMLEITPRVALAPLFLTWFGFGITSKIVMAATICFFPVLLNVIVGLQTVDHDARTLMRSLGATRWEQYRKLELPSSLPNIFAGLKNAITLALIGAIVAEFVGASEGLGVLVKTFNFQLEVASGFAVVVALLIFGLILYGAMELLDKKIVFWKSHR